MPDEQREQERLDQAARDRIYAIASQVGYEAILDLLHDRSLLAARVEELERERIAVIRTINLYGDRTLHEALTDAGLLSTQPGTAPIESAETRLERCQEALRELLAEIERVRTGERHPEHLYRLATRLTDNPATDGPEPTPPPGE